MGLKGVFCVFLRLFLGVFKWGRGEKASSAKSRKQKG